MSQTYLLVINGKPEGPFSLKQLKDLNIRPVDFVRTGEMDDYKEAHEIAELRDLMGFNRQVVIPQYFGSFDQRLLASVLDWFFVSLVCALLAFVTSIFFGDKEISLLIATSLLFIIPAVNFTYHVITESSAKQGTYGKQLLKIKVSDMEGNRISFGRATGRNLAKLFSVTTLFVGYLFSFFNKQQQCLHDIIAGTLVIKDRLV